MNTIFETVLLLQKDSYFKKLYYFARCFSALTTAQIVLNSQFSWKSSSTAWLQKILLWLSFPVQNASLTQHYWLLAFAIGLILATTGLYYLVCRQILAGTMDNQRLTQALRLLLGLLLMLFNPILNILLASFNCDWVGGSYLSLNWDTMVGCTTSTPRVILMCVSAVAFVPLMGLVLMSALMHVSDPKSGMVLTRAHSRVELVSVAADAISNGLFGIVNGYKELLAAIYIVLQLSVVASYVVFQPFYHSLTNDVFTMLAAVPLWAGLALAVLLGLSDDGSVASAVLLAGVAPFGVAAFWASRRWRSQLIEAALQEHDPSLQDELDVEVLLSDEEVFPVLREKYDRNSTTFFMIDVRAALVEVKTRFLVEEVSGRGVAVAENILKKGLLEYPQSVYLRLQYVSFLLYHRKNPLLASVRLEEILGLEVDPDIRFSLLRMRREVERIRHVTQTGSTGLGSDSLSLEDVKHKIKSVRALHRRAIELQEKVWKTLARKKGAGGKRRGRQQKALQQQRLARGHSGNLAEANQLDKIQQVPKEEVLTALAPIVDELQGVISTADKEYAILWAQCRDSKEVGAEYARYLRNIKKDTTAADEIDDQLATGRREDGGGSQSGDDRSSRDGASSTGSASIQTIEQQQRRARLTAMTEAFTRRISAFKLQLRGASLVLVAATISAFAVSYMLSQQALPVFDSFLESGNVRFNCALSGNQLRLMHLYAMQNNGAAFNKTRTSLNNSMLTARDIQYGLMSTYRTSFDVRNDFTGSQTIDIRRIGAANAIVAEKISPYELILRMIDFSLDALSQPMSRFATTLGSGIVQFPAYFFVLENMQTCTRTGDTVAETYRQELKQMLGYASLTLIAMLIVIVITELMSVTLLIRPTVNRTFADLADSISRFALVPLDMTKHMAHQEEKHLTRFRILAGDENDQMGVGPEEQGDDFDASQFGRSRNQSQRRVRVAPDEGGQPLMSSFRSHTGSHASLSSDLATTLMPLPENIDDAFDRSPRAKRAVISFHVPERERPSNVPRLPISDISDSGQDAAPLSALRLIASDSDDDECLSESQPLSPAAPVPAPASPQGESLSRKSSDSSAVTTVVNQDNDLDATVPPAGPLSLSDRLLGVARRVIGSNDGKEMSKRKAPIVVTYLLIFIVICAGMSIMCAFGMQAVDSTVTTAATNINAARRRSIFYFSYFFASEYFYSNHAYSLVGSGLSSWTPEDLSCRVTAASSMAMMLHYGILYGTSQGFEALPVARNLPSVDSIVNSACSPMTTNIDYFYSSIQMEGVATLFSNFYFVPQCPTTFDFAPDSVAVTDPRFYRRAKTLSAAACPLYISGQATNGFHRLVDGTFMMVAQVAKSNVTTAADRAVLQPTMTQLLVLQDTGADLMVGSSKIVFLAMESAINSIIAKQKDMIVIFVVMMCAILFQYVALGRRLERLLKNVLVVALMCDRMMESASDAMKKQGYTAAEIKCIMKSRSGEHDKVKATLDTEEADSEDEDFVGLRQASPKAAFVNTSH